MNEAQPGPSLETSEPLGARPAGGAGAGPGRLLNQRCQLCSADLSEHKRFYKRYRVCERDALAVALIKDGELQRFCQQCGRFHVLTLFDGTMRTCREQLARHATLKRKRRRQKAALRSGLPLPTDEEEAPPPRKPRTVALRRTPSARDLLTARQQSPPPSSPAEAHSPFQEAPQEPEQAADPAMEALLQQLRQQRRERRQAETAVQAAAAQQVQWEVEVMEGQASVNSQPSQSCWPALVSPARQPSVHAPSPRGALAAQKLQLSAEARWPSLESKTVSDTTLGPSAAPGTDLVVLGNMLRLLRAASDEYNRAHLEAQALAASSMLPTLLSLLEPPVSCKAPPVPLVRSTAADLGSAGALEQLLMQMHAPLLRQKILWG